MKARLISSLLLVTSLGACASVEAQKECYAGYIALAAVASSLDGEHERRHDKKRGH